MRIFVVRRGDSVYSIARSFGIPSGEIIYVNQLSDPGRLSVGQALVIPGRISQDRGIEVNAYAYPNISLETLSEVNPYLTFLCPFSWQISAEGAISPINDEKMISLAKSGGTAPLLTLTNIGTTGGFSSSIAHSVLTDSASRDALIDNIMLTLRRRGYYGVNLNLEYVYPFDRESYNAFSERLSTELHSRGYYLISTLAPKTSDEQPGILYEAHDYAAHGRFSDRVVIMTYEWGYTYSAPQAVSPVNRMRQVLDYAVTKIPSGKILLGMSDYGYDWRLPWKQGEAARVISNSAAQSLASATYSQIYFDETARASHFNYKAPDRMSHGVWFEDARSFKSRLALVEEYGLAGVSYWTINSVSRAGLYTMQSMYSTEKVF